MDRHFRFRLQAVWVSESVLLHCLGLCLKVIEPLGPYYGFRTYKKLAATIPEKNDILRAINFILGRYTNRNFDNIFCSCKNKKTVSDAFFVRKEIHNTALVNLI